MNRQLSLLLLISLLVVLAGCGGDNGPKLFRISGTVTFDGQPVKDGDILFVFEDSKLGPDAGKIVDGKFSLMAKAGKTKVKITAARELAGKPIKGAMGENLKPSEQFIPACYNDATQLTAEIPANGPNGIEFLLTSGKEKKGS